MGDSVTVSPSYEYLLCVSNFKLDLTNSIDFRHYLLTLLTAGILGIQPISKQTIIVQTLMFSIVKICIPLIF